MSAHTTPSRLPSPWKGGGDRRAQSQRRFVRADARPALLALWAALDAADEPPPCRADPERWFPDRPRDAAPAIAGCNACPVAAACLAFAVANKERAGVFGGRFFGPHADREDVAS